MKRNYAAERREAGHYANGVINKMPKARTSLDRERMLDAWDVAYKAYLAGLRASQRR
jgi:hypothetical protein